MLLDFEQNSKKFQLRLDILITKTCVQNLDFNHF